MQVRKKQNKGAWVPYPLMVNNQSMGFPLNWDFQSISRALGIPTASTRKRGKQLKLIRADLAQVCLEVGAMVFPYLTEAFVRTLYCEYLRMQKLENPLSEMYSEPSAPYVCPTGVLPLKDYSAYVSMAEIKSHMVIPDAIHAERILGALHDKYGIPVYRSLYFSRDNAGGNRVKMYRKELAHLLLYPNIGQGIKVKLVEQDGTLENLRGLIDIARLYDHYDYITGEKQICA